MNTNSIDHRSTDGITVKYTPNGRTEARASAATRTGRTAPSERRDASRTYGAERAPRREPDARRRASAATRTRRTAPSERRDANQTHGASERSDASHRSGARRRSAERATV